MTTRRRRQVHPHSTRIQLNVLQPADADDNAAPPASPAAAAAATINQHKLHNFTYWDVLDMESIPILEEEFSNTKQQPDSILMITINVEGRTWMAVKQQKNPLPFAGIQGLKGASPSRPHSAHPAWQFHKIHLSYFKYIVHRAFSSTILILLQYPKIDTLHDCKCIYLNTILDFELAMLAVKSSRDIDICFHLFFSCSLMSESS
jgi:hypothetical protein